MWTQVKGPNSDDSYYDDINPHDYHNGSAPPIKKQTLGILLQDTTTTTKQNQNALKPAAAKHVNIHIIQQRSLIQQQQKGTNPVSSTKTQKQLNRVGPTDSTTPLSGIKEKTQTDAEGSV